MYSLQVNYHKIKQTVMKNVIIKLNVIEVVFLHQFYKYVTLIKKFIFSSFRKSNDFRKIICLELLMTCMHYLNPFT